MTSLFLLIPLAGVILYVATRLAAIDARDNAIIYGSDAYETHDVQQMESRQWYTLVISAMLCVAVGHSGGAWWPLLASAPGAIIAGWGALYWGWAPFQEVVNRSVGKPAIDPDEDATWWWPSKGRNVRKRLRGSARRFQRPIAAVIILIGLAMMVASLWI